VEPISGYGKDNINKSAMVRLTAIHTLYPVPALMSTSDFVIEYKSLLSRSATFTWRQCSGVYDANDAWGMHGCNNNNNNNK